MTKIEAMTTGGRILGEIKKSLQTFAVSGVTFAEIEAEAQRLIKKNGVKPSFSTVAGYSWATCIMKNEEMCHGIPSPEKVVTDGDIITIDVGLINEGFHLDTTTTFGVGNTSSDQEKFLETGRTALRKAINKARPGNTVYDISSAMFRVIDRAGFGSVYQLTGHGVGEVLHGEPEVPCIPMKRSKHDILSPGQTLAIESMYTMGNPELIIDKDGWTYQTKDGSLSAMFEETVLLTEKDPLILTK